MNDYTYAAGFSIPYAGGVQVSNRRNQVRSDEFDLGGRVARMESDISYIKRDIAELKSDIKVVRGDIDKIRTTDFRIIFGALIATALGLAGLMARGFHWI
ncbi:TPA: hypothetical protein ACTD06_000543 [Salmonella enterica subsp. enterica serovar Typhimurium]